MVTQTKTAFPDTYVQSLDLTEHSYDIKVESLEGGQR